MSLTKQDLQNIEHIVENVVERKTKNFANKGDLNMFATKDDLGLVVKRIEQMESRVVAAMGLLQRDTFTTFEDHENRISRLEKKLSN